MTTHRLPANETSFTLSRLLLMATAIIAAASLTTQTNATDLDLDIGGHVKPQLLFSTYPDDSVLRELFGSNTFDANLDTRVVLGAQHGRFSFDVDYQLVGLYGDRIELSRELPPELQVFFPRIPDDRARLMDLTHVFTDSGKTAMLHRLDRLAVGFASERAVLKIGRQAISWGNGLTYTAMDIFNPFDPAAVDKEYKTGDDMIYGQYLRGNGDDLQGVAVFRRNPITGDVETDVGSLAAKYHGMTDNAEFDALAAQHFGDTLIGGGGNIGIGGAVWRGDLVLTFTGNDTVMSLVTSLSTSWTWGDKNISGVVELFYNGFGQDDGCYSPACLEGNPELLKRVARGELFTLGRPYLAVNAMVEVNPLFMVIPNLFVNLEDPSAMLQVVFQNDLRQNLLLSSAINLPMGADGSEFGGADSGVPGLYLSAGPSFFVQLAWYW